MFSLAAPRPAAASAEVLQERRHLGAGEERDGLLLGGLVLQGRHIEVGPLGRLRLRLLSKRQPVWGFKK